MPAHPTVVYTDSDDLDPTPAVRVLEEAGCRVTVLETRDSREILDAASSAEVLCVGYAPLTADMLDALPALRVVSLLSQGSDNVDVAHAARRGVWVATVAGAAAEEVATHAWSLVLALVRRLAWFDHRSIDQWLVRPAVPPRRLSELRVGLVGLGSIGRRVAEFAVGSVGELVAHDPHLPAAAWPTGIRAVDLPELVSTCDVISLHVPLSAQTSGMVDRGWLSAMPAHGYLVNVARGGLVDEEDLKDALDSGHLAGAGLDVWEQEPPVGSSLYDHPAVIATPHVGYLSDRSAEAYVMTQADNVLAWLRSGRPLHPINAPQPWPAGGPARGAAR